MQDDPVGSGPKLDIALNEEAPSRALVKRHLQTRDSAIAPCRS